MVISKQARKLTLSICSTTDLDRLVIAGGNWFRLQVWLQLTIEHIMNELLQCLNAKYIR
jgi:hypothetical protein